MGMDKDNYNIALINLNFHFDKIKRVENNQLMDNINWNDVSKVKDENTDTREAYKKLNELVESLIPLNIKYNGGEYQQIENTR